MTGAVTLEPVPLPEPAAPPTRRLPAGRWVRANLFATPWDAALTLVFGALLLALAVALGRFLLVGAEYRVLVVNLTNLMVGSFPREQLLRPWLALGLVSVATGWSSALTARRLLPTAEALRRAAPLLGMVVVLLGFTRSVAPALLAAGAVGAWLAGRLLGLATPERVRRLRAAVLLLAVAGAYAAMVAFGGVGWNAWGGLLLTLFLAVAGIVLAFPLGVLLALGRRSTLPAVRMVSTAYIEFIRGVPLVTVLFIGAFVLGFFLPAALRPENVTRALVALVLFETAYIAEVVRGGLQGVPPGQTEAAQAIGLSPLKTILLIVLPQGLRNVLPALVGQFITLFKDTSLVQIIGLSELLSVSQLITGQPDFAGRGLQTETLLFVSLIYWAFCYSMSRASQRLEMRLGVGIR